MVKEWTEQMDRAKYPEAYEAKKDSEYGKWLEITARKAMCEVAALDSFYNPQWFKLVEQYPELCCKIEELRMGVPSMEEHALLQAQVRALELQLNEMGLIVAELWEHRVRGKPKQ